MKNENNLNIIKNLKTSHFAAVILAQLTAGALIIAIRQIVHFDPGYYGGLLAIAILIGTTLVFSKLFFRFSKKDAVGLAIALFAVDAFLFVLAILMANVIGYPLPEAYSPAGFARTIIFDIIYYGALTLALKNEVAKKAEK